MARKAKKKRKARGGRRRKSTSRRRPATRRRRRSGYRARGRRRSRRSRRPKFVTYRTLARRKGVRAAAKTWRRRRKYVRSNPFSGLLPSVNDIMGVGKTALQAGAGWVGVNAGMFLLDKLFLAKVKANMGPGATVAVNTLARLVLTPVVAKLGARYLGLSAEKVATGGALNVGIHAVQDASRLFPNAIPASVQPLLLGYDGHGDFITMSGYGDFITPNSGVGGYLPANADIESVETVY